MGSISRPRRRGGGASAASAHLWGAPRCPSIKYVPASVTRCRLLLLVKSRATMNLLLRPLRARKLPLHNNSIPHVHRFPNAASTRRPHRQFSASLRRSATGDEGRGRRQQAAAADDPNFQSILDAPPRIVRAGRRHGPGIVLLGRHALDSQAIIVSVSYASFLVSSCLCICISFLMLPQPHPCTPKKYNKGRKLS